MTHPTVRDTVAQMVMPRLNGIELADPAYRSRIEVLVREGIGGFILFGGDVEDTPRRLQELQALAKMPLLISSDIERGLGQQLAGATRFPNQRAVASAINPGSKKDRAVLDRMLDAVRSETRAAGTHVVFSPVMDVNSNPDNPIICTRAFGDDPEVVEWFGSRYITALQKPRRDGRLDLLACAKHFPGHGDTDQDSHSVLPVINDEKAKLNRIELPPFRQAVKEGVAMVMVAHLLVPAFDPGTPATFSKKIVTALLREGIAFDGLIISDALDMGALTGEYSQEEIAVRAVEAGIDILLHPVDAGAAINAVTSAIESGRLTEQRVRESAERIVEAKKRLGLFEDSKPGDTPVDYKKHRSIAGAIAANAPRVVGGDKRRLPLSIEEGVACFVVDDDGGGEIGSVFLKEMGARFPRCSGTVVTSGESCSASALRETMAPARSVVIALFSNISATKGRSGISPELFKTVRDLLKYAAEGEKTSVVISFDSPYILEQFSGAHIRIAAFDRMDEIQAAVAALLSGKR